MDEYLERLVSAAERTADLAADIFNALEEIRVDVENMGRRVDELADELAPTSPDPSEHYAQRLAAAQRVPGNPNRRHMVDVVDEEPL